MCFRNEITFTKTEHARVREIISERTRGLVPPITVALEGRACESVVVHHPKAERAGVVGPCGSFPGLDWA